MSRQAWMVGSNVETEEALENPSRGQGGVEPARSNLRVTIATALARRNVAGIVILHIRADNRIIRPPLLEAPTTAPA